MRNVIDWIKTNPISVVSAGVAVVSLGVIGAAFSMGKTLQKDMDDRAKDYSKISGLMGTVVEVMAPTARTFTVTANQKVVAQVTELNQKYDKEFALLQKEVPLENAAGHALLRAGVLPGWTGPLAPTEFKARYIRGLVAMLGSEPSDTLPRLNAGPPRPIGEISAELDQFSASYFPPGDERALTEDQREDMEAELKDAVEVKLRELLADSALRVSLYAETDPQMPGFPLPIGAWAYQTSQPEEWQVFEGQMEFWIIQDVLRAIQIANADSANVTESPVKHLHMLELDRGYVGLQTSGLVPTSPVIEPDGSSSGGGRGSSGGRAGGNRGGADGFAGNPGLGLVGGDGRGRMSGRTEVAAFGTPMSGFPGEVTGALSDNFYAGPTGRVSNPMYVVRHVKLVVTLESRAGLSALVEAVNGVNRMTVLNVRMEDVDEYQMLYQGYVYGQDDVVNAELTIETLWFTSWLKQYMPEQVRHYLGIEESSAFSGEGGADPFGGMGGFDEFGGF